MGQPCSIYWVEVRCIRGFGGGNLRERENFEDVDSRITLRCIFSKSDVVAWTGSIWLRIGTGGGHLRER